MGIIDKDCYPPDKRPWVKNNAKKIEYPISRFKSNPLHPRTKPQIIKTPSRSISPSAKMAIGIASTRFPKGIGNSIVDARMKITNPVKRTITPCVNIGNLG